ncbi:hypothetical protein [Gloeothece verrucosa]|uniref:Uncharacterized protein n=1 Tax=Gloeothece verrucosa (strain PCC 7822) TaxID=497965 RepID=E0UEY7_GLOV7|nr:hypothetical protein [Gloeothece verrucosa]ADN13117.1 conserved hypothetical protein [Gloeothece verrucosa PCC 7822]
MTLTIPSSVTFEQAIELTQQLLEQISQGTSSQEEIETLVTDLVKTLNGARGFFVVYITGDYPLDDSAFQAVLSGLKTSPKIVSELLTKNVSMSTAMAITHTRNNDPELAQQSRDTQKRTVHLIQNLPLLDLSQELDKLRETLEKDEGVYHEFLNRWHYDSEQRQAIYQVIKKLE